MSDLTLEQRVAALEQRLEMESGLRASQDRDHGDLEQLVRGQGNLLQAMALTQMDHTASLREVGKRLAGLETRSERTETALQTLVVMIQSLIDKE